jgi:Ca-activated chloride channel family protein
VLSAFYARISTPVLTNIELDFGEISVYDLYPQPLPDLFAGVQVILLGRYRNGGETEITLTGQVNGEKQVIHFPDQEFSQDSRADDSSTAGLARLWATRKIGYLLSQVRLEGSDQETIDQIVQLSIRYGIVTPYTSYLVTEPMPLGAASQQELARDAYQQSLSAPNEVSGQQAVEKADQEGQLAQAEIAPPTTNDNVVRTVWSRSFVKSGDVWTDTAFDPDQMDTIQAVFLSEDYFALAHTRPDVAAALALGEQVIIIIDGQAYEIITEGESDADFRLPESVGLLQDDQPVDTGVSVQATTIPDGTLPPTTALPTVNPTAPGRPGIGEFRPTIGLILAVILLGVGIWLERRRKP